MMDAARRQRTAKHRRYSVYAVPEASPAVECYYVQRRPAR